MNPRFSPPTVLQTVTNLQELLNKIKNLPPPVHSFDISNLELSHVYVRQAKNLTDPILNSHNYTTKQKLQIIPVYKAIIDTAFHYLALNS